MSDRKEGLVARGHAVREELVVLGSSGHAREILSIAEACGAFDLLGCIGPPHEIDMGHLAVPRLGDDSWLSMAPLTVKFVIGIGSGHLRARLDEVASASGRLASRLVHPRALIGHRVGLSAGCVVGPGAVLTIDVAAGRHVHVGANVTVGHDAVLDDYVTLLPGCTISGSTRLGRAATVGAGATVIDGVTIGPGAMVGAGAVVIRDVPANATVVGVPARQLSAVRSITQRGAT